MAKQPLGSRAKVRQRVTATVRRITLDNIFEYLLSLQPYHLALFLFAILVLFLLAIQAVLKILPSLTPAAGHGQEASPVYPVVVWAGFGDSFDGNAVAAVRSIADEVFGDGAVVYPIALDRSPAEDRQLNMRGNVIKNLEIACADLTTWAHSLQKHATHFFGKGKSEFGFYAVGFSQGGLFLRALVQTCPVAQASMRRLITFGSPHGGMASLGERFCNSESMLEILCKYPELFSKVVYSPPIQKNVVPATYFKMPKYNDLYIENSLLLAVINGDRNESALISTGGSAESQSEQSWQRTKPLLQFDTQDEPAVAGYRLRFAPSHLRSGYKQRARLAPKKNHETLENNKLAKIDSLEKLVLVMFENDDMISPKEAAHFGEMLANDTVLAYNHTRLYKEDLIGLRALAEDGAGRLKFLSLPGKHMQFSENELQEIFADSFKDQDP